ncbi:MAG: amidohydrolase family protein [Chloroflexi bacterium]|nr:amidohydrolase family protein [Chloroflexota bacterium]
MKIIRSGILIDSIHEYVMENYSILIEGSRIKAVLPTEAVQVSPEDEVIDATAYTVIPGMVDCHTHVHVEGGLSDYELDKITHSQADLAFRASANARKDLEAGFTTIRCLDAPFYVDVALRNAINAGLVIGPRMRTAGQGICVTGGHMDKASVVPEVMVWGRTGVGDGPWGCRRAAREQLKRGADTLKVNAAGGSHDLSEPYRQEMSYEEMAAVCEEARWAKVRVAAHAHGGQGITDGIRAGLNSIEHAPWLSDEQTKMMAEKGVFYVPTLTTHTQGLAYGKERTGSSEGGWNWILKVCDDRWVSLERAHKAGVKVCVGTDAGFWAYHGKNAMELEELVNGGYSPMEAIIAATRNGAECLDMDKDIGTIEAGKLADLVFVKGNPLTDVSILQRKENIVRVYKGGEEI